ncbi:Type III pantothenate kinase [Croceitalea dokdonensis DOKDO 023]|uniref:Type III pantothenate kinase n=1 Tax=Croceitalea dokdonensis DOKDO 023 TaxID=1300341 RepID=A0A0P7A7C0_9FLAO|nr:type III pantothenate kinase [Croceitalea dokdonensis]KPM32667.1 Type III pantothenate kinase [Croceitalea dokdonensis DOKDO 023]
MNLVVDIGNTRIKQAVFEKGKLLYQHQFEASQFLEKTKSVFEVYPNITDAIISSVKPLQNKEVELLSLFCKVHVLSASSKLPFFNEYATPQSLGVDRIALAAAAHCLYPQKEVLVIDAGTCITFDFVDGHGAYLGGSISPGMMMRYRAMHQQTAKLPLLEPLETKGLIGNTTETSMHFGVINGIVCEIDGIIDRYQAQYGYLTVILTGGDVHFFEKRLKNSIFANSNFLLEGLNFLLEHNKN